MKRFVIDDVIVLVRPDVVDSKEGVEISCVFPPIGDVRRLLPLKINPLLETRIGNERFPTGSYIYNDDVRILAELTCSAAIPPEPKTTDVDPI